MSPSRASPHAYVAALCLGLAGANAARSSTLGLGIAAALLLLAALAAGDASRPWLPVALLLLVGWWWGGARLAALDRSVLLARVDTAERTQLVVTGPARRSRFQLRVPADVTRFGRLRFHEPVLLELPLGRAPPQGAVIETIATVRLPRPKKHGFDERTWLKRLGIHVVLRADRWTAIGHRGGLGGLADALRARLARSIAPGLHAERRGVVQGIVLGDEQALSESLRQRFRASGLYHLLAVSGQNVALVAAGALALVWLIGLPRWAGQLAALGAIGGYVLAVAPLLYLAFATALVAAVFPPAAAALASLNGWCAAYLAGCARLFGGLPGAQVRSTSGALVLTGLAAATGAYAWRRWQSSPRST